VCTTWGINNAGCHLLHIWRQRANFPTLKRAVQELAREWKPNEILLEDTGAGTSLRQQLLQDWPGFDVPQITPIVPRGSKALRAQLVAPMFEAGKVFFSNDCPLLSVLVDELISAPNSVHDDAMDSLTQARAHLRDMNTEPTFFEKVERPGFVEQMRSLLARPLPVRHVPGGFHEERPIVPAVEHEQSPAAAAASTRIAHGWACDGDLETVAFDSIRELMGED